MANRKVRLKNRSGDILYPYTDNIPTASTSTAGKVKLDSTATSGSQNAITSGAAYTALAAKADKATFQVVTSLPTSPSATVFYFVKE